MKPRRILLVACLACASADATAAGDKAYSCTEPSISQIQVRPVFKAQFLKFNETRDPAERTKRAQGLRESAREPTEREWAKMAVADVLAVEQKQVEAGQLYEEVAASRVVSRGTSDAARIALANLALQRDDHDGALAWVEPMAAAGCKAVEDSARRLLAYLYQEKGRLAEALEQVDKVSMRGAADADHWRAVRIDFRCTLQGEMQCIKQIGSLARDGYLGTEAQAASTRQLTKMRASESGHAALAYGKEYGVLDEQGQLVVAKAEEPVPVRRPVPIYPRDALNRGITGYVDIALVINPDGSVKTAEVWDSRPMNVFDLAVLRAVRGATFKPRLVDGKPVEGRGLQRYQFVMKDR